MKIGNRMWICCTCFVPKGGFRFRKVRCCLQVTDETAEVLMRANYKCNLRGPIFVKGKGIITTYFAKTPFDDKKSAEPRIAENYQRM